MSLETPKFTVKLFIGCFIDFELNKHLNRSIEWKHANILHQGLQKTHFQGKEYIGLYVCNKLALKELTTLQSKFQEELKVYCPATAIGNISISIFPQVFIA